MLTKAPLIYRFELLLKNPGRFNETLTQCKETGEWVPARPVGYFSMRHRLRCAWMVFTGRADVLVWLGKQ